MNARHGQGGELVDLLPEAFGIVGSNHNLAPFAVDYLHTESANFFQDKLGSRI